ncbi:hypothetical protein [Actinoallomurus sp. CA-142502]|uniref:hypothetical protein n=1 Tax=Actinoallomurus sp. CA-142502 TaxID=3239885 RepID=UPI003D8CFA10
MATCSANICESASIFTTALNDQIVFLHPCRGVTGPPVAKKPLRIVTPTEFESIVDALPGEQWSLGRRRDPLRDRSAAG